MKRNLKRSQKASISKKILLILIAMVLVITFLIGSVSIIKHKQEVVALKSEQCLAVGNMAVALTDGNQMKKLSVSDTKTADYEKMKQTLSDIKTATGVKYIYAVAPLQEEQKMRYLVEGQTPTDNPDDICEFNHIIDYSNVLKSQKAISAFDEAFNNGQYYNNGLYKDTEFGYLMTVFIPVFDSNGKPAAMIGVDLSADDIINRANQLMYLLIAIAGIGIVAMFLLSRLLIQRIVIKPLKNIVLVSDCLADGDVNVNVNIESDDEIGQLAYAFQKMIEHIREQTNAAQKIAAGDLSVEIVPKSDKDILSVSLLNVIQELGKLSSETGMLTEAALEGELSVRGNADAFSGGYKDIINGVNAVMNALIEPLRMSAVYIEKISAGEIPTRITDEYHGDFNEIKINLNNCIDVMNGLIEETSKITLAVKQGQLDLRGNVSELSGSWGELISGVNNLIDAFVSPINIMAEYMEEIGAGEIPPAISDVYYGDFNEIKNSINSCIRGLDALNEGKDILKLMSVNDYSMQVEGSSLGIYAEIANSINDVSDRIRNTIRIMNNIASGDLSDIGSLKAIGKRSENDTLMPSMITMIETIQTLIDEAALLTNAAIEGKLDTKSDSKGFNGAWKNLVDGMNSIIEEVAKPLKEVTGVLNDMATGNLHVSVNGSYYGDFDILKQAINFLAIRLGDVISEITNILSQIADGNLAIENVQQFKGDYADITNSLNTIIESLNSVMGDINEAAEQVSSGSRQVSDGSQALSQGSTEQASSIQELTASIIEIASQTKQNAVSANQASELASNAKQYAEKGNDQMKEMLNSMNEISESSSNIAKIIKVIDDIAFQTNILALNAAVEAARAGQHGKGFAVVAEEVRNLAARSAEAAKDTTGLIEGSINKVQAGTIIANDTATALNEIVGEIEKSAALVGEIAIASNEQASGIAQINKGIEQVSLVVQNNSATAEQSAAASEELSSQAELLKEMVGKFKLNQGSKSISGQETKLLGDNLNHRKVLRTTTDLKPSIMLEKDKY